jgi:SnoaL-like domain
VGIDPGDGSLSTPIVQPRHLVRRCRERLDSVDRLEIALPPAVADLPAVKPSAMSFTTTFTLGKSVPEVELLRAGYAAFNARDPDAILATMTPDVTLPNGVEGGYVHGHQAVRAYWKRQWSIIHPHDEPISFHREDSGQILVDVHQVVRDLAGAVLSDQHLGHRCTIEHGLVHAIEVCPLLASVSGA